MSLKGRRNPSPTAQRTTHNETMYHTAPPAPYTLPRPVGAALARLPAWPGSRLLVAAINVALARHLPADVRALLQGKRLAIRVRDARLAFDFTWSGQHFVASRAHAQPDLVISANAQDFLLLAQRRQDPDTLFFNRRLVMEGDTELGLMVKNALDALELPVLDPWHWTPHAVLSRRAPQLARLLPPLPGFARRPGGEPPADWRAGAGAAPARPHPTPPRSQP